MTTTIPPVDTAFHQFSGEHSWYKHIPLPESMAVRPVRIKGVLRWCMYHTDRVLKSITDPVVRDIVTQHTMDVNALIYSENHGSYWG